jgi:hypothetical protein
MNATYDTDFYSWTQQQANLLKAGRFSDADFENIIEEIESMGRSEKRELESRLTVLLHHLLKWQYQSERRGKSWTFTINEQRRKLSKLLSKNPGLLSELSEVVAEAYDDAVFKASYETGINSAVFPQQNPWKYEQIINPAFFPEFN